MPMLNGIKFSCEPCMRGHRSSKCNHTDRILVKVRKPGRPLSSCPHTLSSASPGTFVHSSPSAISNGGRSKMNGHGGCGGNSCSCEVTSVAIPKVTSCGCGVSVSSLKSHASCAVPQYPCPETKHLESLVSPSAQGGSVFSVNKAVGLRHRAQKKSIPGIDGAMARRSSLISEDAGLELLRKAQEVGSSGFVGVETGSAEARTRNEGQSKHVNGTSHTDGARNGFSSTDQGVSVQHQGPLAAGGSTFPLSGGIPSPKPDIVSGTMSVNGWNPETSLSFLEESSLPDVTPLPSPGGGCCRSSRSLSQAPQRNFNQESPAVTKVMAFPTSGGGYRGSNLIPKLGLPGVSIPTSGGFPSPQYTPPHGAANPLEAPLSPATGPSTINYLLTPQELAWIQYIRTMGLPPPPRPHVGSGAAESFSMAGGGEEHGVSQKCDCGPGCNCLGCVSHPYNRRTVEYVKELHNFAVNDQPTSPFQSQSSSPTLPQSDVNGATNGVRGAGESSDLARVSTVATAPDINGIQDQVSIHNHYLPPSPDLEGSNGGPENGQMSPSAFVLVEYQIGPCSDTETVCECGDGCICLSCSSHGKNNEVGVGGSSQWATDGVDGVDDLAADTGEALGWWDFGSDLMTVTESWQPPAV